MTILQVYIARHCPASVYALDLAQQAAVTFPQAEVSVIDVDDPAWRGAPEREAILFTPAFVLDGRPIFWGNPRREELFQRLRGALAAPATGEAT
jgi:hypothetical protein